MTSIIPGATPGSSPAAAMQEAMLEEFREVFHQNIASMVWARLGRGQTGVIAYCRRWAYAPLAYTLENRRNFFRGCFTLLASPPDLPVAVAAELASNIEIAWSCALIVDDIIDRSDEREGTPPAYRVFGTFQSVLAVVFSLGNLASRLFITMPGSPRVRAARAIFSLKCALRCMATQLPGSAPRSRDGYILHSQGVNISHHWALLAPLAGRDEPGRVAARRMYADHMTVAGKMRNDLLDYFGGSSERESRFEDFRSKRISFPTMILEESSLSPRDRKRVMEYFHGETPMETDEIFELFDRHAVGPRCLDCIAAELREARKALTRLTELGESPDLINVLDRWTRFVEDVCRERIDHHQRLFRQSTISQT